VQGQIEKKLDQFFGSESFVKESVRERYKHLSEFFGPYNKDINNRSIQVVTVAGSNGKGQSCHQLAKILSQNGKKCAIWTSPHIKSVCERFSYRDQPISEKELLAIIDLSLKKIPQNLKLSYYEFLFFCFLEWCQTLEVEVLILEVGLGGRFDTVNMIDPSFCGVVSISRDHCEILGNRYDQILFEKLGITRPGVPLVTSFQLNYLRSLCLHHCTKFEIPFEDIIENDPTLSLKNYSFRNFQLASKLALKVLGQEKLDVPSHSVEEGILGHGRGERMTLSGEEFIFLGTHNLDGLRQIFQRFNWILSQYNRCAPLHILCGLSSRGSKDIEQMLKAIKMFWGEDYPVQLCSFDHPRSLNILEVEKLGEKFSFNATSNYSETIQDKNKRNYLVIGSYFFVGEIKKYIDSLCTDHHAYQKSTGPGRTHICL
jgi:dihydrofolate synthase / folylpolyglutamate synthase